MGLGGAGVGKKGEEEGEAERGRWSRVCVWSSLGHQPQPQPPPPPPISKIAFSTRPRRGASAGRANSGSREQSPAAATCQREKQRPDPHTRPRVLTRTARVLSAAAPPPPGGGWGRPGPAGVQSREPQKGFPAWAGVELAPGGERGSGPRGGHPASRPLLGPPLRQRLRAARRSALGSTPAGIPGWTRG